MRSYLVAMTKGRDDRASAVCVEDGDASAAEIALFRRKYAAREIRRVDYPEMLRLMSAN